MMNQTVTRKELKYVLTREQYEMLYEEVISYMRPDTNGINGLYKVTSLYFNDDNDHLNIRTNKRTNNNKLLRLRTYGDAEKNSSTYFETKQHDGDTVIKSRRLVSLQNAYLSLHNSKQQQNNRLLTLNQEVPNLLDDDCSAKGIAPQMIINYDRHALYELGNDALRMTFDFNVLCRNYDLFLEHGAYGKACLHPDYVILEVKIPDQLPIWLSRILQELGCEQCMLTKHHLAVQTLFQPTLTNNEKVSKVYAWGRKFKKATKHYLLKVAKEMRIST